MGSVMQEGGRLGGRKSQVGKVCWLPRCERVSEQSEQVT